VVLNIGYDPGVLKPALFAMMVIMALVTTFMTGHALDIIAWAFRGKTRAEAADALTDDEYNILISFGNAERGKSLLRLANALIKQTTRKTAITAIHL
jgi:predicted ribonuclease YlaK